MSSVHTTANALLALNDGVAIQTKYGAPSGADDYRILRAAREAVVYDTSK